MRGIITRLDRIVLLGLFAAPLYGDSRLVTRGFDFGIGYVVTAGMSA